MRAYVYHYTSLFKNGLRAFPEVDNEGSFCLEATNLKPYSGAMVNVDKLSRSFSVNEAAQIFRTSIGDFLFTSTTMYQISPTKVLTQILTGLTVGGAWSCADFRRYIVFTNGSVTIHKDILSNSFVTTSAVPLAGSLCNANGRLIMGNMKATSETNKLVYSEIGSTRIPDVQSLDAARVNTGGFVYMPWAGSIFKVLPMGKDFVAYGSGGITAYVSSADGKVGEKPIDEVGIPSAYAAVFAQQKRGAPPRHFFISNDGTLYGMGPDFDPKQIGYEEFIGTLANVRMSFNTKDNELIVGQPTTSLILTEKGMGAISGYIEDCVYSAAAGLLVHASAAITQTDITLTSDILNFSWEGFKTVQSIFIDCLCPDTIQVGAYYRHSTKDSWSTSGWTNVTSAGVGYLGISAVEFKLRLKIPSFTSAVLHKIKVTVQLDDKRFVKGAGVNANQTSSESAR